MAFAVVEFGQIVEVIWVSAVAGLLATALFALVILGSARAAEARRGGTGSAAGYGVLAFVAMAAFLGLVVFGLTVILNKS